ncbi:hypothetical protein CRE_23712 [Caenorhabditis remanei]|uniref:Uncharacterized protein n=1 Tax=Caenorhabditis remanei TaxID=31234 RepID=E3N9B1_CAERE|nr:hypothetical protein CRE_23712 [Caenorhabditis remanei]
MPQIQDKDINTALNEDQESKKMSTSPAEQVNKTRRTESNSTTNDTSPESEDDSSEANNQYEIEPPPRLGTITQLILPFDGKMTNYGIFNSQFDHLINGQRYQARAEATCQALAIESSRRILPSRVLGARIHLASETLGPAVQSPSSTDCSDGGNEELGVPQRRLRVADKLTEDTWIQSGQRIQPTWFRLRVERKHSATTSSKQVATRRRATTRCERRVQTDKKEDDVDEKTLTNKLIKEFQKSFTPDGEGRIHIGLPYTGRQGELVDNSVVAKQRLSSLLSHLQEKEAKEAYQSIIAEQKDSGITEEVKPKTSTLGPEEDSFNKYFIKHSMMIKIRADKKSEEHQLFRVEGAETSDH